MLSLATKEAFKSVLSRSIDDAATASDTSEGVSRMPTRTFSRLATSAVVTDVIS
jgi:hypothetical protein